MLDLHQINCTPAVAPVPLQSELWHRTSCAKCNTWEPGASDPPCLLSGFVVFSRLLSINFLRTVISGNSLKQYAVSHVAAGHDLSRYRELHFLRQNHVARIIPTFTVVSADPWRRNVVWSLYCWLYCWSILFSRKPSEMLMKLDPWPCILSENRDADWGTGRILHLVITKA